MEIPLLGKFTYSRIYSREGYNYMWQVLLADIDDLLWIYQSGPKRVEYLNQAVEQYGYKLRGEIQKVVDSTNKYNNIENKINDLEIKINTLQEEIKELKKIKKGK